LFEFQFKNLFCIVCVLFLLFVELEFSFSSDPVARPVLAADFRFPLLLSEIFLSTGGSFSRVLIFAARCSAIEGTPCSPPDFCCRARNRSSFLFPLPLVFVE
jgi:hypothetical protein